MIQNWTYSAHEYFLEMLVLKLLWNLSSANSEPMDNGPLISSPEHSCRFDHINLFYEI